mmetsp:Transcript_107775/g.232068  ORF Transcript_107775/g.232068 Transcript_107775/m.232068 type:complete len:648 (-) Transcript_107775:347-2290(-)
MAPFERAWAASGLGDSFLRLKPDAKDGQGVDVARQQVILRLLRQVPISVSERSSTVMLLLQCGILTQEVLMEIALGGTGLVGAEAAQLPIARLQGPVRVPAPEVAAGSPSTQLVPVTPKSRAALTLASSGDAAMTQGASAIFDPLSLLGASRRFEQDFERLELLGRGAFGEVWKCRHRVDGQEYAIKAVRYQAGAADIADVELRVLREAKLWAGVSHPNIARYHNSWVEVEWEPGNLLDSRQWAQLLPPQCSAPEMLRLDGPCRTEVRSMESSSSEAGSVTYSGDESESGVVFGEPSAPSRSGTRSPPVALTPLLRPAAEPMEPRRHQAAGHIVVAQGGGARAPGLAPGACAGESQRHYVATLYIQAELCSKETLMTWIARKNFALARDGASPEETSEWARQAAHVFRQCLVALAHLHKLGCAHRDVKPSNIFLSQDGNVRIGDFGLARVAGPAVLDPGSEGAPERHGPQARSSGVGTPSYASPEQLRGGEYGVETDVYALGIVLAELLCTVGTHMERAVLLEDLRGHRRLPDKAAAAFPLAAGLVLAMTNPEPSQRPTPDDILRAISFGDSGLMAVPGVGYPASGSDTEAVANRFGMPAEASGTQSGAPAARRRPTPLIYHCRAHCSYHCRARSRRLRRPTRVASA